MEDFVFASYARIIKDAWRGRSSQPTVAQALCDGISNYAPDAYNQVGGKVEFNRGQASLLFRRMAPIQDVLITHKDDPEVLANIDSYFEDNILPKLEASKIKALTDRLIRLISESDRPEEIKGRLCKIADDGNIPSFLAASFLESLARDNELHERGEAEPISDIPDFTSNAFKDCAVPSEVTPEESRYVRALLDAYGDAEGITEIELEFLDTDEKCRRYKGHFGRQRQDYFNADYVRHSTRGAASLSESTPFSDLEREIKDSIIDTYESDFSNGFERLKACLDRAGITPVSRSWFDADPRWLSVSVKKGVCHVLVNEKLLEGWVR